MILKLLTASVIGYSCSKALNHKLHQEGVPEMFRYAFGVMLVILVGALFVGGDKDDAVKGMMLSAIGIGTGVGAARLLD